MIDYIIKSSGRIKYVEVCENTVCLDSEEGAMDLTALCLENGTDRLLLPGSNIGERFFDLKSGLAGAVLQKFSNYSVRMAAVIPREKLSGRFGEMALEANRGRNIRFATDKAEAVGWITGE